MNSYCAHSPSLRHTQRWNTGGPIRRDHSPLKSICEWCDEPITRAHKQSGVWFIQKPQIIPEKDLPNCLQKGFVHPANRDEAEE